MRLLILLIALATINSCSIYRIGKDPTGLSYKKQMSNIEKAILMYKEKKGVYPENLKQLIPDYLEKLPRAADDAHFNEKAEMLFFYYSPSWPAPGRVGCSKAIGTANWKCMGYI